MKALEIKKLDKTYWDNKVLKSIDLDIESGDFFALLGYNWAGKTTTIWILTDLVRKDAWLVKVFWEDIDKDFSKAKKYIWVVPQEFNFNIFQNVMDVPVTQAGYYWVPKKVALERTEKYLRKLWLWEKRNNEARELSGGMKRRLMIVRALVHEPKFLILDEPTAWVDVELRQQTWEFIQELNESGITILLTTHYLEEVEALCNKVAIINKWKIVENTTTKKLLAKLDEEIILLDIEKSIEKLDKDLVKKYKAKLVDKKEIEISISRKQNITDLISDLSKMDIIVTSFRNKRSRLEQLFINITKE